MSTPPEWSRPLHLHFTLKTALTHSFKFHRHFLLQSDWLRFPTSDTDRIAEVYLHPQTNPSLSPETTIRKGVTHHSGIQKNAPLSLLELMSDPHQCKCCLVTPYIRKYPTSRSIAMEELGRPASNTLTKDLFFGNEKTREYLLRRWRDKRVEKKQQHLMKHNRDLLQAGRAQPPEPLLPRRPPELRWCAQSMSPSLV